MRNQIRTLSNEDAHLPHLELDPRERQFRQQCGQCMLGLAHFTDQQTLVGQVIGRIAQDT